MQNIEFEYIIFLLFPLIFLFCEKFCPYRATLIYFPHISFLKQSTKSDNKLANILKWTTIIFASIALSSPVVIDKKIQKQKIGYDIVLALDASGSMRYAFDINKKTTKFDITKKVLMEFADKRKNDNLGLVAFGKYAFIVSPLTFDKKVIKSMIKNITINPAYSQGTAIGEAIMQSLRIFKNSTAKNKILILATDGDEEGDVAIDFNKALNFAKKAKIKIYTIGIGQNGRYNYATLKYISLNTNAKSFKADDKEALKKIFQKINSLEKSKIKANQFVKKQYLYVFPLFIAMMALLGFIYLKRDWQ